MTPEVEIKFACSPEALESLAVRALEGPARDQRLVSVYFDTPEGDLARRRASLRLRTDETGRTIQTFKTGTGLDRAEVEVETPPGRLHLEGDGFTKALPLQDMERLAPRFTVQVRRRTGEMHSGQSRIELALDQGEILAGGDRLFVCEAELELVEGDRRDLFALALELVEDLPLTLSLRTKAARGNALAAGVAAAAVPASPAASLEADLSCGGALRLALLSALDALSAQVPETSADPSAEAVHRLRIALRRFRSLLSVFRPRWAPAESRALGKGLRALSRACGSVRELDVLTHQAEPAGALVPALLKARRREAERLVGILSGANARRTLLEGLIFAEDEAWRGAEANTGPAETGLADDLQRRWRRIRRLGRVFGNLDAADRHDLRLRIKALRYAVESLDLPGWKPLTSRLAPRLKAAQDALGALNDAEAAAERLAGLGLSADARAESARLVARLRRKGERAGVARAIPDLIGTPLLFIT